MALKIAKLEAEKKALAAKLEDSEAKLQANHDEKHAAFYKNPKKAYAWVVGKTVPAFLETKTASSSVPSVGRTVDAADNQWEMLWADHKPYKVVTIIWSLSWIYTLEWSF